MTQKKIVVATIGSRGDVQPYINLCQGLRDAGHDVVLATTTNPADDVLEQWAKEQGVLCYRGSEDDVLLRVVEAQRAARGDVVVEITGDCIFSDPEIIDVGVLTFLKIFSDPSAGQRQQAYSSTGPP